MKRCCIIGHRKINYTPELEDKLKNSILQLITKNNVRVFLFSSKSEFVNLCYDVITQLKSNYPNIRRVFVRAEYPIIDDSYTKYLLSFYEETYFYSQKLSTSKLSYIKRNEEIIKDSDFCLFYFDKNYAPPTKSNSGTQLAFKFATKKRKTIINLCE